MERNELCWCGSGKKYKKCHMPIEEKMLLHEERGEIVPSRKLLKTPHQIEMIKKSAALNTAVLDEVAKHIHIGMSTAEIDEIVYRFTTEHGGIPAPLNYEGFPKSVCTSINNEICHGIPDENIFLVRRRHHQCRCLDDCGRIFLRRFPYVQDGENLRPCRTPDPRYRGMR